MQNLNGFNLIELMMVVIIVGILSTLCVPMYSQHLIHEKRLDAEIHLVKLASRLEQYYLINNTYQNATLEILGLPAKFANDQYQLVIASATDAGFTLRAEPLDKQAQNDVLCATLLLNSSGKKEITGAGKLTDCWQ